MQGVMETWAAYRNNPSMEKTKLSYSEEYELKMKFLRIARNCTKGVFTLDGRNKKLVGDLFNYFLGLPGELDFRKGLWLEGPVGTGKSMLMYVFSEFMKSLQQGFQVYICSSVTTEYALSGDLDKYLLNENGFATYPVPMCFDELGREPIPSAYYGQKMNVMQHILHVRYSYWQTTGLKTYVTTNCDANKIGEIYGDYIRDRRKEMFNKIVLAGSSRR